MILRHVHKVLLAATILLSVQTAVAQQHIERQIDSLIALMTVEEKAGQLNQLGAQWSENEGAYFSDETKEIVRKGLLGSVLGPSGAKSLREMQRLAVEESRLGIPLLFGADVIHGYRTVFPVPIAEASTWDPDAVRKAARIAAVEASAAGIHWTYAPMVDIARDPRWGRIVEGSGEDPYLGSVLAVARVKGFQGDDLADPRSVMACAKHFAAYGAPEAGRDYNTVDMSERTLRDVYLPPFKAAVDAGVGTLMSAFNEIGGVPSTSSRFLMTDVLRKEWGFQGFVVSDYDAVGELTYHGVAGSHAEATRLALTAGVEIDMVTKAYVEELPQIVKSGAMPMQVLNEAVRRVLRMKFKLGLFVDPYRGASVEREKAEILTPEHIAAARETAGKAIVLLKNEMNILPLSKATRRIALIGPLANNKPDLLGPWHASGRAENVVTVLAGLKAQVSAKTSVEYVKGCEINSDSAADFRSATKAARAADVVVMVLGESERMSGEAASRSDIGLPAVQQRLLKEVLKTGRPVILVLMNGRPLTLQWESDHVPTILETWFLGMQTGNAIADVLFGAVNPSGKLPVTFPRNVGQIPIYYNHKNSGRPFSMTDKYTSKYLDVSNAPLYPFGYGLSYTTFSYANLSTSPKQMPLSGEMTVSVDVTNTGRLAGDEVVQLYVRDLVGSVTRPVKELKGFRRVSLQPGETQKVEFTLRADDLSFYNEEMKRVTEPGEFRVFVGGNSVDCLETSFEVTAEK